MSITAETFVRPALAAGLAYVGSEYVMGQSGLIDLFGQQLSGSTAIAATTGVASLGTGLIATPLYTAINKAYPLPSALTPVIYEPLITGGLSALTLKLGSRIAGAGLGQLTPMKAFGVSALADVTSAYAVTNVLPTIK